MMTEIPKQLFKDTRNWFIWRVTQNNSMYAFTEIEGVQLKNILKRLIKGITKKYGEYTPEQVFNAFQDTVEFADKHGYSLTCLNLISKFNNIMEHIRNERTGKHNKGFDPNQNTWITGIKTDNLYTGANELFNRGVRQISNGKAGSDSGSSDT